MSSPGESVRETYRRQGQARERERIIELLERAHNASMKVEGSDWQYDIATAITLIKGLSND